jgi:hypothetical protein
LDALYEEYEDQFEGSSSITKRFDTVMEAIDTSVGAELESSIIRNQVLFYSLFTACYDHMYGLQSKYTQRKSPRPLPAALPERFLRIGKRIAEGNLPDEVMDAIRKSTTDKGRRTTRHEFFMENLGLVASE